jgi:hypothetical protein
MCVKAHEYFEPLRMELVAEYECDGDCGNTHCVECSFGDERSGAPLGADEMAEVSLMLSGSVSLGLWRCALRDKARAAGKQACVLGWQERIGPGPHIPAPNHWVTLWVALIS